MLIAPELLLCLPWVPEVWGHPTPFNPSPLCRRQDITSSIQPLKAAAGPNPRGNTEVERPQGEAGWGAIPGRVFPKQDGADRFGSFLTLPGKTLAPLKSYSKEDVNSIAQGHTG